MGLLWAWDIGLRLKADKGQGKMGKKRAKAPPGAILPRESRQREVQSRGKSQEKKPADEQDQETVFGLVAEEGMRNLFFPQDRWREIHLCDVQLQRKLPYDPPNPPSQSLALVTINCP